MIHVMVRAREGSYLSFQPCPEIRSFRRWDWAARWVREDVLPFEFEVLRVDFTGKHAREAEQIA